MPGPGAAWRVCRDRLFCPKLRRIVFLAIKVNGYHEEAFAGHGELCRQRFAPVEKVAALAPMRPGLSASDAPGPPCTRRCCPSLYRRACSPSARCGCRAARAAHCCPVHRHPRRRRGRSARTHGWARLPAARPRRAGQRSHRPQRCRRRPSPLLSPTSSSTTMSGLRRFCTMRAAFFACAVAGAPPGCPRRAWQWTGRAHRRSAA